MENNFEYTFESIKNSGYLMYQYLRGSQVYGLSTPESDIDTGGIFIVPENIRLGLEDHYRTEVKSPKNDDTWFEIGKFMKLLERSNPNILEALFIPEDCIIFESSVIKELKKHRESFLTKECFPAFGGYAVEQIKKAHGYKKKIVRPVNERLGPLDFCYTFKNQGSTKIKDWLSGYGLFQKYCGLINIPNMHETYGVYYDWGQHFLGEKIETSTDCSEELSNYLSQNLTGSIDSFIQDQRENPLGYRGMIFEENILNDLHLSSIPKGHSVICWMTYNHSGYNSHCIDYRNYQDWVKNRNQARFDMNKGHQFDAKNIMHSFRLIRMCTELARGEGFNLRRTTDRDFLLDIKKHKVSYNEIKDMLVEEKKLMDEAISMSTLPEKPDQEFLQDFLIWTRKRYSGSLRRWWYGITATKNNNLL